MSTTGPDLVLVSYRALTEEEQDEAFELITQDRLERIENTELAISRHLRSLRLVKEHLGKTPTTASYRKARKELAAAGTEIEEINTVIRYFGSWSTAVEALELSGEQSDRAIAARLSKRDIGKVWRYTEEGMRKSLAECVAALGHVPQVAEYEHWRQERLRLLEQQKSIKPHIPSAGPFRRRYGSWEKALLYFGYTSDEVAERLERTS